MTDIDDLEQLNLVARYRNRLDDIRTWRAQLTDIMLTITGYSMDLTGIPSTGETPMPGGDALAMLAPWSPDADHGDDLPHPDQVLREWCETISGQPSPRSWATCWRWHWDNTQRILETPWANQWRTDIDALRGRLQALAGEAPEKPAPTEITYDMIIEALQENPEHRISRKELGIIFDIPASTITTWRSRGLEADEKGSYRAGDILERIAG